MFIYTIITSYIRMLDSDWLIAVIFFFLQIQALHCEFAEFLLHVGVFNFFSWYLQNHICRFYPSPRRL